MFTDLAVPTTFLLTSFYWDNFIYFGMGPKKDANGKLAITLPMGDRKLPGIAAEDIGRCAYGIFQRGPELIGKTVGIAGEHLSGAEMADEFTRALARDVYYNEVAPEAYRSFGFPGAEDLGNMFQIKRDFNDDFRRPRNPDDARRLNPSLQNFRQWLAANKSRIPLEYTNSSTEYGPGHGEALWVIILARAAATSRVFLCVLLCLVVFVPLDPDGKLQATASGVVFRAKARDEFAHRRNVVDVAHPLPHAPDIFPRLGGAIGTEVHRGLVRRGRDCPDRGPRARCWA